MNNNWKKETIAVQGGYNPASGEPRITPVCQSTTYRYEQAEDVAKLFDLQATGHIYSRLSNPTVEVFEKKVAELEGATGALAVSSGQAAISGAILNICGAGDHVVSSSALYGGTVSLFTNTFKKLGIDTTFVDPDLPPDELKEFIKPNTKAIYGESLANPALKVLDFEKFAALAKSANVPLIIDNTFPTPYLCNPFELGANIVLHSATKYMDGHATSLAGIILENNSFDWNQADYPGLTEPDPSYHGVVYTRDFPEMPFTLKGRVQYLRDFGCCLSPMNAFLCNLGLETLHLRMERHCANALALARFLEGHKKVKWVNYPGLESSKYHAAAKKYLRGCSGVLTFGVDGGTKEGEKVMNSLKLAAIVVHVADARTCVLHPASMTHRQLSESEQLAAGVSSDLIRVSVGIESIDDLKADFDQALNQI